MKYEKHEHTWKNKWTKQKNENVNNNWKSNETMKTLKT